MREQSFRGSHEEFQTIFTFIDSFDYEIMYRKVVMQGWKTQRSLIQIHACTFTLFVNQDCGKNVQMKGIFQFFSIYI